jgi:hypothetical protein
VVPLGIAQIQPRLIGDGPATIWVDDFAIAKRLNVNAARQRDLPPILALTNSALIITAQTADATLAVLDRRTGQSWTQTPFSQDVLVTDAQGGERLIRLTLLHLGSGQGLTASLQMEPDSPEFVVELKGQGDLPAPLKFPYPFTTRSGQYLVVPMNEDISYPVEDKAIEPMRLIAYGGHGICMAFWGVTDGVAGQMAILETPDDAAIRIDRVDGRLAVAPEWESQKGRFGYRTSWTPPTSPTCVASIPIGRPKPGRRIL